MPTVEVDDLIGCTFLKQPEPDGQHHRAKVVCKILDPKDKSDLHSESAKFLVHVEDGSADEIISYNELLDYLLQDVEEPVIWHLKKITVHQGLLNTTNDAYKGSAYNVLIKWEDGSCTYKPLLIIAADDPVSCTAYTKQANLLDTPGWKQIRNLAKRSKKLEHMIHQVKLQSYCTVPIYQFGYCIPQSEKEAKPINQENGNTKFQDAMELKLSQLWGYDVFRDLGKGTAAPEGYKKIKVHFVYTIKQDG